MKGYIGEFEELVLLTIASLGDEAYGVSIKEDIETRANRTISIGALHSTITRLEEKGLIKSRLGEPTQERRHIDSRSDRISWRPIPGVRVGKVRRAAR